METFSPEPIVQSKSGIDPAVLAAAVDGGLVNPDNVLSITGEFQQLVDDEQRRAGGRFAHSDSMMDTVRLERLWRPEDASLFRGQAAVSAPAEQAVGQAAEQPLVESVRAHATRDTGSVAVAAALDVPGRYRREEHAQEPAIGPVPAARTYNNLFVTRVRTQPSRAGEYEGTHRAPQTMLERAASTAKEQVTDRQRRNRLTSALLIGAVGLNLAVAASQLKPEAARAAAVTSYGTDSSHSKPEQVSKIVIEKVAQLSDRQEQVINSLSLTGEQKAGLTEFADTVIKLKYKGELKGVNTDVMTAQWSQETGNGTSSLGKKYHNYFGIKAKDNWKGPKVRMMTTEEVNGKLRHLPDNFRVYKDMQAGILGYRDKLKTSPWFHDALGHENDSSKTLDALLDDGMAWATDSSYKTNVLNRGKAIKAHDITKVEEIKEIQHIVPLPKPVTSSPEVPAAKEPRYKLGFKLKYKNSERQQILEVNESSGAWITLPNGKKKLDRDIGRAERIKIIESNLNNAHVSPEGFKEFQQDDFVDLTGKVPKLMDNYDGNRNGQGTPKPKGVIKRLVHHYTATNSSVDAYDGTKFAWTMQHSGSLGVQFDTNKVGSESKVYWLTKSRASHVKGFNSTSWGNENHAPSQVGVSAAQYENDVYLDAKFLIDNKYIDKSHSVSGTVDKMMVGHHEMNPFGHNDFPAPVMDVIRAKLKYLLVQMGYKR